MPWHVGVIGVGGGYPNAVIALDPTWYYRFENGDQYRDSSVHRYDLSGSLGGASAVDGIYKGTPLSAREFFGGQSFGPGGGRREMHSIVFMVHPKSGQTEDGMLVGSMGTIAANHDWYLAITPAGQLRLFIYGQGTFSLTDGQDLRDSDHLVGASYDEVSGATAIYVDGVQVASGSWTKGMSANGLMSIGGTGGFGSRFYIGVMDEIAFWDWDNPRVLTAADHAALYAAWRGDGSYLP